MEIDYLCNRCEKVVKARVYKAKFEKSSSRDKRYHNRVDCTECGRYIKFIGDRELSDLYPNWRDVIDYRPNVVMPGNIVKKIKKKRSARLAEIDFKLDLILDHLGVKNGNSV